jgi:hypothetical protein
MQRINSVLQQFRRNRIEILCIGSVSSVLLGLVVFLNGSQGIAIADLTRDPSAIVEAGIHLGFLSQMGILFWSASATVCLLTAAITKYKAERLRKFLLASGFISLGLGLDDTFLLHETFFPRFGIPEKLVFLTYAGIILLWLIRFHRTIFRTEFVLLGISLLFFGASIAQDIVTLRFINPYLIEDGAKLIGIVSWLAYFIQLGKSTILNLIHQSQEISTHRYSQTYPANEFHPAERQIEPAEHLNHRSS